MERQELLLQIQEIFVDVIDEDDIILSEETTSNDIEGWDSLTHIQLIVAIEKQCKMKFNSNEINSWKNVGQMLDCILSK